MIDKCANPLCDRTFAHPTGGTLFLFRPPASPLIENDPHVECFWLCEECIFTNTIVSSTGGTPVIIPLGEDDDSVGGWNYTDATLYWDSRFAEC